jgi:phosphatidate cytidylyltransferase
VLRQRVLTALIAVVLLLSLLFFAPPFVVRIVIALLFAAAAWEWSQFLDTTSQGVRLLYVALVVVLGSMFTVAFADAQLQLALFALAIVWWLAAFIWVFNFPTPIPTAASWVCGLLVLVPAYVALDVLYLHSPWLLLALLVVVWLADIGAYFAGRRFGRVKLAPRVSPGKTWEGLIGGVAVSVLAAAAIAGYRGADLLVILPLAAAVVLVSVVGDLSVSMFKRHAGIKDSGTLFPGHGGVLDRIDSVSAAAPVFVAGTQLLDIL